jgi:hypothetical protein
MKFTSNGKVIFREPAPARRGYRYGNAGDKFDATLRNNPNRWAVYAQSEKSVSFSRRWLTSEYERAYRTENGKTVLYVRYIGGEK